jgi:hypothetical protein
MNELILGQRDASLISAATTVHEEHAHEPFNIAVVYGTGHIVPLIPARHVPPIKSTHNDPQMKDGRTDLLTLDQRQKSAFIAASVSFSSRQLGVDFVPFMTSRSAQNMSTGAWEWFVERIDGGLAGVVGTGLIISSEMPVREPYLPRPRREMRRRPES